MNSKTLLYILKRIALAILTVWVVITTAFISVPSFVAIGMTDADGSAFYKNAGSSDEYDGCYNVAKEVVEANYAEAYEILCKYYEVDANGMLTNFPTNEIANLKVAYPDEFVIAGQSGTAKAVPLFYCMKKGAAPKRCPLGIMDY